MPASTHPVMMYVSFMSLFAILSCMDFCFQPRRHGRRPNLASVFTFSLCYFVFRFIGAYVLSLCEV